ncbi:hypothetical protein [Kitasatospora sp. NPDC056273]|uniref:hypothetical protein n=1 Tax=Kitasatospora sp. NPDC056273 TaxID=3345769 RepID=UPI0035D9DC3F
MLDVGTNYAGRGYRWTIHPPAAVIILMILCFNVIGDACATPSKAPWTGFVP